MATIVLAYKYGSFAADSTLTIGTDISASDAASLVGNGEARWGTAGPLSSSGDVLPLWTANTVYPAQTEILDPTGATILVRKTTGTSRSTYDATEQALWSAAGAGGGGSLTVQDENSNVSTSVTQIDFQGAGVTASAGTGEVVVTIPGGGSGSTLTPTAVKTANYTAAAGDLVPVDTTSASRTVTLPTAPADKSQVGVKHVVRGGTNTVTIACGGSDVFNKAGGSTTATLTLLNQGAVLQYAASTGIWYVVSDDLALSQLDARYDAAGAAAAVLPTQATHANSFLKTDGTSTSWGQPTLAGWFNLTDYGAKVDGKTFTDGAVTTGTPNFTSASTTFTSADTGKVIKITGAGAAGADLVTTITYVSAHAVTLAVNASTTVSAAWGTYGTDDTAAWQSAINATVTAGGGTVYVPPGLSVVAGSQVTGTSNGYTYSGQIVLPQVSFTSPQVSLRILGSSTAFQVMWGTVCGDAMPPDAGHASILFSTATSGSVFDANPGLSNIGAAFTNIVITVENLIVRVANNPQASALNFSHVVGARVIDCVIGVDAATLLTIAIPTGSTSVVGLALPVINNGGVCNARFVGIYGFPVGITHSEHTILDDLAIEQCGIGLFPQGGNHLSEWRRMGLQWNGTQIKATNTCYVIGSISMESKTGTVTHKQDILGSNWILGRIDYVRYGVTASAPTYIYADGAANSLALRRLDQGDPPTNIRPDLLAVDYTTNPSSESNNFLLSQAASGQIPWSVSGTWGTVAGSKAGLISGSGQCWALYHKATTNPNTVITATFTLRASNPGFGIAFRGATNPGANGDMLCVYVENDGFFANSVLLGKVQSGAWTANVAQWSQTVTNGATVTLVVTINGNTISASYNGTTIGAYTLSTAERAAFPSTNTGVGWFTPTSDTSSRALTISAT